MQDYHLHTVFSQDASLEMHDLLDELKKQSIQYAAITDHVDFDPKDIGFGYLDYPNYINQIRQLQKQAAGAVEIALGVEIGIQSYFARECDDFIQGKEFDFIIGSVHMVNQTDLHNGDFYKGKTKFEAFGEYLQETFNAVCAFKNFDVLGHLDLVSRYGQYEDNLIPYPELAEICEAILKELISSGRGIEVNSSGLRYPGGRPCPAWHIVKHYHDLGGEIITVGSDAHKKSHVGFGLKEITSELSAMGFKYLTYYKERKPSFINL